MRLDHLLSKEKVGVGLLSSCQGVHAADFGRAPEGDVYIRDGVRTKEAIWRVTGREVMQGIAESWSVGAWTESKDAT